MTASPRKRNIVLSILFFLPVAFVIVMMLLKNNYNALDLVNITYDKSGFIDKVFTVSELPDNDKNIKLKDHITVLSFLGKHPNEKSIAALNLKEIIYDRSKGFKKFQIVVLITEDAKAEAEALFQKIKTYEDMRFWHFVTVPEKDIKRVFNSLKTNLSLDENLSTNSVFLVDKDLAQRGRLDDRTEKEIEKNAEIYPLYDYDCIDVGVLKNKLAAEDIRLLFTEYRQKRKGQFENSSDTRRKQDLKNNE